MMPPRTPLVQLPTFLYSIYHNRINTIRYDTIRYDTIRYDTIRYTMTQSLVIYNCETCMFITRNKKDYTRHLNSRKHIENHPAVTPDATVINVIAN